MNKLKLKIENLYSRFMNLEKSEQIAIGVISIIVLMLLLPIITPILGFIIKFGFWILSVGATIIGFFVVYILAKSWIDSRN